MADSGTHLHGAGSSSFGTNRCPSVSLITSTRVERIKWTTLAGYPDLRVVIVGAHYSHWAAVRPLLSRLSSCVLELSRYEVLGDVARLVKAYGAERFIYGSFYPRYAMGPILFYLHHIGLTEADLSRICAGGVEELLST